MRREIGKTYSQQNDKIVEASGSIRFFSDFCSHRQGQIGFFTNLFVIVLDWVILKETF